MIGISHAAKLAPLLRVPATRRQIVTHADELAREQDDRRSRGVEPWPAAIVTKRLIAAPNRVPRKSGSELVIRDHQNAVLARGVKGRGGALTISLPTPAVEKRAALHAALDQIIDNFAGET